MSIMNKYKMPMYRQTGGVLPQELPGVTAQRTLDTRLASGTPFTGVTGNYETDLKSILDWSADPRNIPQYYTDQTVAEFDPLQQQAHQRLTDVAGQTDALTNQLLGDYQALPVALAASSAICLLRSEVGSSCA